MRSSRGRGAQPRRSRIGHAVAERGEREWARNAYYVNNLCCIMHATKSLPRDFLLEMDLLALLLLLTTISRVDCFFPYGSMQGGQCKLKKLSSGPNTVLSNT